MKRVKVLWFVLATILIFTSVGWGQWKPHTVRQLNGRSAQITLPTKFQIVTESWQEIVVVPYLVYMPEKDRLLMLSSWQRPHQGMVMTSDDHGASWSQPKYVHTDAAGKPDTGFGGSLTYLGNGKVLLVAGEGSGLWFSNDYGETWSAGARFSRASQGESFQTWDPLLVDRDPATGKVVRLAASGYQPSSIKERGEPVYQAVVRWSTDEGRTWSETLKVRGLLGFNEFVLLRAKNGDLVAACRSDGPKRFKKLSFDHYSGLGVSISKDNAKTWSKVNMLYDWGRHHPSLVLLPNGDIVMSYVVRRGYPDAEDGFAQFGIEAVVSHDNGQTWDLDHRYILATWKSTIKGSAYWYASSQATSTVLLPDGSLLTAFGTGYRTQVVPQHFANPVPRDVGLVQWRLGDKPLNADRTIAQAPFDSDLRNKFDLDPEKKRAGARVGYGGNLAVREAGAKVRASASDEDPNYLLYDGYTHPVVTLTTMPTWVEVSWPQAYRINEIRLYPGAPVQARLPNTECVPLDYRLQYQKGGEWVDLVPPVTNAVRFREWAKTAKDDGQVDSYVSFQYVHKFAPVRVKAIRVLVSRTSDAGLREGSGKEPVIPEAKRETVLRRIDVSEAK